MFTSYLKIALRNVRRYKGYSFINMAGLAIGIAAFLLILLYVQDELSYDTYHTHAGEIYRLTQQQLDTDGSSGVRRVLIDPPLAPLMKDEFPEVTHAARLTPVGPSLSYEDRHIDSGDCYWADPDVFEIFSIPFIAGDPQTALDEPFSLVLSASKAAALFGDEEALGKTVIVNNDQSFKVTGVFEDVPHNTHLPTDVLGSMATLERWFGSLDWDSPNYATYVRLADGASAAQVEQKLPDFLTTHRGAEANERSRFHLQAVTDIHLRSHRVGELAPNGDIRYIYLFVVVALFILFIACINFTNLATAQSMRRAREVGVRKVVGAGRMELVRQFVGESILFAVFSLVLAVALVEIALPFFNNFTGKELGLVKQGLLRQLLLLLGVSVVVGIAAGSYPAFYLSGFRPAAVLKNTIRQGRQRATFRSMLVVAQFVIAIVLWIGTFGIYEQLRFVRNQKLGFDQEQMLVLPTVWDIKEDFDPFREQVLQHRDVIGVTQSNPVPSQRLMGTFEASAQIEGNALLQETTLYPVFADQHFFPTYGIEFTAGRNFSNEFAGEAGTGFILNATAVRKLGWEDPAQAVGALMRVGGWRGSVIGVVSDFHFESLHQQIAPMVFYMDPRNYRQVSIRLRPGADLAGVIDFLEAQWGRYEPNSPLSYSFLDERIGAVYQAEQRLGRIFGAFAFLAIFITCLGLYGMASISVERRTKEIGIRKVLGSSPAGLFFLLFKDSLRLVILACIIAAPIASFAMQRWMGNFAYHAQLPWWIFVLAGVAAILVSLATISYQSVKAALANPIKSLRYE